MPSVTTTRRGIGYYAPFGVLLLVLAGCSVRGYLTLAGLEWPADVDSYRDIGNIQALLEGNWWGDPLYAGELRFYSPLLHVLAAIAAWVTGLSPMALWLHASPWFNLLAPLTFFDLNRRLFNLPAAAVATIIFALNGVPYPPWVSAGYSPWPIVCILALPLFFVGVSVTYERVRSEAIGGAVMIGLVSGLAFLAHPYPAILLTVIVVTTVLVVRGLSFRSVIWLSVFGAVELVLALSVLGPLFVKYRLHTLNFEPSFWVDPLFYTSIWNMRLSIVVSDLVGLALASIGLVLFLRGRLTGVDKRVPALLAPWIGLCLLLLVRHVACAFADGAAGVCRIPVVPVHHAHFYLQAALCCVVGYAAWRLLAWLYGDLRHPWRTGLALLLILFCIGAIGTFSSAARMEALVHKAYDFRARQAVLGNDNKFDLEAYQWISHSTSPNDLFVTETPAIDVEDTAFLVMATGRRLVAAPIAFSNPYVDWRQRDARRERYVALLQQGESRFCDLLGEAGSGANVFFVVRNDSNVNSQAVTPVLRTGLLSILQLTPDATCKAAQAT